MESAASPLVFEADRVLGTLVPEGTAGPVAESFWYTASADGDGVAYSFAAGTLAEFSWLTVDLLLDGDEAAVWIVELREGKKGPKFGFRFGALNQCSARLRMPLEATKQNRWMYEREGALLKPSCQGDRVDLARVDRMTLTLLRHGPKPVRWCMTPLAAVTAEPPRLGKPLLPKGPLMDELGQSTLREWTGKTRSVAELKARLTGQLAAGPGERWPEGFSRFGGWTALRFDATGFFRTHHDGRRWWLVDPEGCAFWSVGPDCVSDCIDAAVAGIDAAVATTLPSVPGAKRPGRPHSINTLGADFQRVFGAGWREQWKTITLGQLRRMGFNTIANWSDIDLAREAGFPYVRPLNPRLPTTPAVFRDFPDVFHPAFERDAALYAEQLRDTRDDRALIGYFLMNEPTWGFAPLSPAEGMLFNTPKCATRSAMAESLRAQYASDEALSKQWGIKTSFPAIGEGEWKTPLTPAARADLEDFSTLMVGKLFGSLSDACRKVDPNHLNLGGRYYTTPPAWALKGMTSFDVFSINGYQTRLAVDRIEPLYEAVNRPLLIGEWHFGAMDVGLPAAGIGHVRTQADRGRAYRFYTEDAAAKPWCLGVHWFTLYDQSVMGRFDGENYNIGFLDTCNRPYEELVSAARATHERVYRVAMGEVAPYADAPEYLPLLFY